MQNVEVIKTVKMKKAIPAEMIQIKLEEYNIKSSDDIKVVVR